MFAPGDRNPNSIESSIFYGVNHCLCGFRVAPAGFVVAGTGVVAVQCVAEIPANFHICHNFRGTHLVDFFGGNRSSPFIFDSCLCFFLLFGVRFFHCSGGVAVSNRNLVQCNGCLVAPPVAQHQITCWVDVILNGFRNDPRQGNRGILRKGDNISGLIPVFIGFRIASACQRNTKCTREFSQRTAAADVKGDSL